MRQGILRASGLFRAKWAKNSRKRREKIYITFIVWIWRSLWANSCKIFAQAAQPGGAGRVHPGAGAQGLDVRRARSLERLVRRLRPVVPVQVGDWGNLCPIGHISKVHLARARVGELIRNRKFPISDKMHLARARVG